jgi:hypothetical protein
VIIADSEFFVDYPSLKTGDYDYTGNIKGVLELTSKSSCPTRNACRPIRINLTSA